MSKTTSGRMFKSLTLASVCGAFMVAFSAANAHATTLFTTQQDFTGWGNNNGASAATLTLAPVATPDSDGSAINGLGNTSAAGQTGTPGSLQATVVSGTYDTLASPGEQNNAPFLAALAGASTVTADFTYPSQSATSNSYFQPLLLLNFTNHYIVINPTVSATANANGFYTATYTVSPTQDAAIATPNPTYFQLGFIMNGNPPAGATFNVDNIQAFAAPAVPEPATILPMAVGAAGLLLLKRRRKLA